MRYDAPSFSLPPSGALTSAGGAAAWCQNLCPRCRDRMKAMWSASEKQAARALFLLVGASTTVLLVITLQLVGRSGHTNVVPVAPSKHVEPGCAWEPGCQIRLHRP
jgi:hypothetical protein